MLNDGDTVVFGEPDSSDQFLVKKIETDSRKKRKTENTEIECNTKLARISAIELSEDKEAPEGVAPPKVHVVVADESEDEVWVSRKILPVNSTLPKAIVISENMDLNFSAGLKLTGLGLLERTKSEVFTFTDWNKQCRKRF